MALDPEAKPKEFLTLVVAGALLVFKPSNSIDEAFKLAESFIAEGERRYGKLNP